MVTFGLLPVPQLPVPLGTIALQGYNPPNYLNTDFLKLPSGISESFANISSGTTRNSGDSGWNPAIPTLTKLPHLAMIPTKSDYPTNHTVGFLVFNDLGDSAQRREQRGPPKSRYGTDQGKPSPG